MPAKMPLNGPPGPGAFLSMARAYADAADTLMVADASPSPLSRSPIYFLESSATTSASRPTMRVLTSLRSVSGTLKASSVAFKHAINAA